MAYKCYNCGGGFHDGCACPQPEKGSKWVVICDKIGCDEPACGKGIYALGYIASVCQRHYDEATPQEREDAVRFRYAEG